MTKSQAPSSPPLSVQKNHPASLHFNPSISPQPLIHHHARDHQQHPVPSSHNSTHSAIATSASSSSTLGDSHLTKEHQLHHQQQGLHKPSASSTCTTPGVISLTLDDVEQKISPHSVGSSSSKRHRSLTPPPRKMSPAGSVQLSQGDDEEDDDNHSTNNELEDSPSKR